MRRLRAALAEPALAAAFGSVLVIVVGAAIAPGFAAPAQLARQLTVAAILALVAAGQTLVVISGREGIDLSIGSVMSLAALIGGNVMGGQDALALPGLLAALASGAIVGVLNGMGVTFLRIPPLVMTLGMAGVIAGLLVVLTQGQTSGSASPVLAALVSHPLLLGVPGILYVWAALMLLMNGLLRATRFGFNLYAVGTNDVAAALSGVRVASVRVAAYGLAGALAALAGLALLGYTGTVFVGAGEQYVLPSVIAVVIGGTSLAGGRGGYFGTVAGAVFLTFLTALLTTLDVSPSQRQIIFGATLLLFMVAYGRERALRT